MRLPAIRPWYRRSWIFPRDPAFEAKAGRVLDLYHGGWAGAPLGANDFVLSADEKTSIQARRRCNPTTPSRSGQLERLEHEYEVTDRSFHGARNVKSACAGMGQRVEGSRSKTGPVCSADD